MRAVRLSALLILLLATLGLTTPPVAPPPTPTDDVQTALLNAAHPLTTVEVARGYEDLEILRTLITDAPLVAIGVPIRGGEEIGRLEHRLAEFMLAELGFSVLAIDAPYTDFLTLEDGLLKDHGNTQNRVAALETAWLRFAPMLDLARWIRWHNVFPFRETKVRLCGLQPGRVEASAAALTTALQAVDPDTASLVETIRTAEADQAATAARTLVERLDARKDQYVAVSSEEAWSTLRRHAMVLQHVATKTPSDEAFVEALEWAATLSGDDTRVLILTDCDRLMRLPGAFRIAITFSDGEAWIEPPGAEPGAMVRTGVFKPGPETVEGRFSATGLPMFILTPRSLDADHPVRAWLATRPAHRLTQTLRAPGAAQSEPADLSSLDVVIYLDRITAARQVEPHASGR